MFSNLFRKLLRAATFRCSPIARGGLRLIAAAAMLVSLQPSIAQSKPPNTSNAIVKLRLRLSWWNSWSRVGPLRTTVTLQPLDSKRAPDTIEVREDATTLIELPRGRYQLTTISPMVINRQAYGWSIELPLVESSTDLELSQENAVRLSQAEIATAGDTSLLPRPGAAGGTRLDTSNADTRAQIYALLNRWTSSLKSGDLKAQMSCYAPQLANYSRLHNVSRERVRQEKQSLLLRYPNIRRLDLSNIQVSADRSQPQATAIKTWSFSGREAEWRGQAMIHFMFQKVNGRWAISSEQEHLSTQRQPMTESSITTLAP
jgi:hypothetical protein